MEPITQREEQLLERKFGYVVYPLTTLRNEVYEGLFQIERLVSVFRCSVNGGMPCGGIESSMVKGASSAPCSLEYAANCPLYLGYTKKE